MQECPDLTLTMGTDSLEVDLLLLQVDDHPDMLHGLVGEQTGDVGFDHLCV